MAKQMSYEDAQGTTHATSYWVPVQISINILSFTGRVQFAGFKDAAAKLAGKAAVGFKGYDISAADFATYFAGAIAGNGSLVTKFYLLADERLDTNGVSFFNGASDV